MNKWTFKCEDPNINSCWLNSRPARKNNKSLFGLLRWTLLFINPNNPTISHHDHPIDRFNLGDQFDLFNKVLYPWLNYH